MTTIDPYPTGRFAGNEALMAATALMIGVKKLADWLDAHPACAEYPPGSYGHLGVRQLVYCATPADFIARVADLADGASFGAITSVDRDDEYVTVRRRFGVEVVCDVYTDRRDGAVTGQAS